MKRQAANKILGVIGSPRKKGNTHVLVSKILEGAEKEGASTEILFLNDMNIRECDGCHVCWKGKQCSKKDDMNNIYAKIIKSDIIVFGTPVYWYGPTALMKCFIDRFVYFNCPENRSKIRGKFAVIAIPFEEENPKTADLLIKFFKQSLQYLEMKLIGKIIVPGVGNRGDILKKPDLLEYACELGKKLPLYK
jgi:multimeric flavodoxin WrbA